MASYHCNFSRVSKNKGQFAKAKYDYIARKGQYKNREGLAFSESHNIPQFAQNDVGKFWDFADAFERKNATVAAELKIALPRELSLTQNVGLVRDFIHQQLSNVPTTFAIHNDKDNHNPHVHIMFSFRQIDERVMKLTPEKFFKRASKNKKGVQVGGAMKDENLDTLSKLYEFRECVAQITNRYLAENGFDVRVTHLSHQEQGLDISPAVRLPRGEFQQLQRDVLELEQVKSEIQKIEQSIVELKQLEERQRVQANYFSRFRR